MKVNILHVLFTPITQAHHRLNNSDIAGFLQPKSVASHMAGLKVLIPNTALPFTD